MVNKTHSHRIQSDKITHDSHKCETISRLHAHFISFNWLLICCELNQFSSAVFAEATHYVLAMNLSCICHIQNETIQHGDRKVITGDLTTCSVYAK